MADTGSATATTQGITYQGGAFQSWSSLGMAGRTHFLDEPILPEDGKPAVEHDEQAPERERQP